MSVRIIITGDRYWTCHIVAREVLGRLVSRYGPVVIVHGAAPGVDSAFKTICEEMGIPHESHPAEWMRLGNAAGPIRNQAMVDAGADLCIAVHRDLMGSKGTKDCARRALAAGIPVWLVDSEDVTPKPVRSLHPA